MSKNKKRKRVIFPKKDENIKNLKNKKPKVMKII